MDKKIKIIHLEDNPYDRDLISEILDADLENFEILYAETKKEFTELVKNSEFDIILADMELPDYDGYSALEFTKENAAFKPFIFVSGKLGEEKAVEAMKKGATDYVMKDAVFKLSTTIKRALQEAEEKRNLHLAEQRVMHLNKVLKSIRNVNQLIVTEKDPHELISKACKYLVEFRGYFHAFIALIDESMNIKDVAYAGTGYDPVKIREFIGTKDLFTCFNESLESSPPVVIENVSELCAGCSLLEESRGENQSSLVIALKHEDNVYGFMNVSLPGEFVADKEEQELFEEVAGDISFALNAIKLTSQSEKNRMALEESEKKYRNLVNNALLGVYRTDTDGHIIFANDALSEILGFDHLDDLLEYKAYDFYKDPEERESMISMIKKKGKIENHEVDMINHKGVEITVLISAVRENGDIAGMMLDITERRLFQKALEESEKRFRLLAENSVDCIWVMDLEMKFKYLSPAIKEIIGYEPDEWLGRTPMEFTSEDEAERIKNIALSFIKDYPQRKYESFETYLIHKKGHKIPVEISGRIILDDNGNPAGLQGSTKDITERKIHEAEIFESEKKYRNLVDNALVGIYRANSTGKFEFVNDAMIEIGEFETKEELLQHRLSDFYKDQKKALEIAKAAEKFGQLQNYEVDVVTNKGNEKHLLASFVVEQGMISGMVLDITDRKVIEKNLEESERRISTLMKNLPGMAYRCKFDPDYTMLFVSEGGSKITGYDPEDLIENKTISYGDLILPEYHDQVWDAIKKSTENNDSFRIEYKIRTKNGEDKWLWEKGIAVRNGSSDVILEGFIIDITERKNAEEEIRRSKYDLQLKNIISNAFINTGDFYNSILEILLEELDSEFGYVGFINRDGDLECPSMTKDIFEKCQVSKKSIVFPQKSWGGLWGKSLQDKVTLMKNSSLKTPEGHVNLNSALVSPILLNDKLIGQIAVANKKEGYNADDVDFIESICRYLSPLFHSKLKEERYKEEILKAKDKAEESNKIKSSFLANMSHEMRTPMVGILGFADILRKEITDEEKKEMAEMIHASGKRLMDTLNQILDLSRIESNKQELNLIDLQLSYSILDSIELFKPYAKKKNLNLYANIKDEKLVARLDEGLFIKIMNNLINNAIKYTEKGSVEVILESFRKDEQPMAKISIKDTGIGIPEAHLTEIFEEFKQVSEGISRSFEGTGLGLTITKKYIEILEGRIEVYSKVDAGSEFVVIFPALQMHEEISKDPGEIKDDDPGQLPAKSELPKILLVEDDISSKLLTVRFLKNVCKVDHAANAARALEFAKNNQYPAIIMDINLGRGKSGLDVAKEIRKMPGYEKIPIVAVTAFAMKGDEQEFLRNGCSHYISKPFDKNDFVNLIEEVISIGVSDG